MPTVHSRPEISEWPSLPQARIPQSTKADKFIDIGMCVLVCDWRVKPLLIHMIAHDLSEMSYNNLHWLLSNMQYNWKWGQLLWTARNKGMKELKDFIISEISWNLHELKCVVEALDADLGRLVEKLRVTRNHLVHEYPKFDWGGRRIEFQVTYEHFIQGFNFEKYFSPSHAKTKRQECVDLSLEYKEFRKMMSKYNELEKALRKEIADWEECYNEMKKKRDECEERYKKLEKQRDALEVERDRLKEQVEETETELEEEKAAGTLLEQQLSEKDKKINRLKQQLTVVTEQLRETEEKLLLERKASKAKDEKIRMLEEEKEMNKRKSEADYAALYKDKAEAEHGQSLLQEDLSQRDDTITELTQKLVNIERERIILQNYFDFQTGSKVELTSSGLHFSPLQPQAQTPQNTEWEQLTDTGLCMVVCDCKVKDLIEQMLAHALLKMSAGEVAEKLPKHMGASARKQLSEKLKETARHRKDEEELKDHISKTMGLYQLQCVVEALGEDEGGRVGKLRKKKNDVVYKNYKFKDESEREKFLATYDEFIAKFNFEKYFGSSHEETKEKCIQFSRSYEDLVKMMSEYDDIHKTLEKERVQCKERYDQLERKYQTLKVERDQLKEQVGTKEEQLEEEKAAGSLDD